MMVRLVGRNDSPAAGSFDIRNDSPAAGSFDIRNDSPAAGSFDISGATGRNMKRGKWSWIWY